MFNIVSHFRRGTYEVAPFSPEDIVLDGKGLNLRRGPLAVVVEGEVDAGPSLEARFIARLSTAMASL